MRPLPFCGGDGRTRDCVARGRVGPCLPLWGLLLTPRVHMTWRCESCSFRLAFSHAARLLLAPASCLPSRTSETFVTRCVRPPRCGSPGSAEGAPLLPGRGLGFRMKRVSAPNGPLYTNTKHVKGLLCSGAWGRSWRVLCVPGGRLCWLAHCPALQRVAGLIPSQCTQEATH